ncbi:hypothetical protein T261_05516 [Streptomyces lydicus]|nr:hypothetical protein T261_05516 [Streptomyces lydicus]
MTPQHRCLLHLYEPPCPVALRPVFELMAVNLISLRLTTTNPAVYNWPHE